MTRVRRLALFVALVGVSLLLVWLFSGDRIPDLVLELIVKDLLAPIFVEDRRVHGLLLAHRLGSCIKKGDVVV